MLGALRLLRRPMPPSGGRVIARSAACERVSSGPPDEGEVLLSSIHTNVSRAVTSELPASRIHRRRADDAESWRDD